MNISKIIDAFRITRKRPARDLSQVRKTVEQSLVKKFSTGNINLQLGRFSTERDIDARRKAVCKYKFVD